jgi:DNA-binding HxlR family transcriptional regulator
VRCPGERPLRATSQSPLSKRGSDGWKQPRSRPSRGRSSITFELKLRFARLALSRRELGSRAKLVLVALLDHLNCQTGRCFPTRRVLADDLGVSVDTIKRGLKELEEAGWITRKLTRGAPWYGFPFDRVQEEGAGLHPLSEHDGEHGDAELPSKGCSSAPKEVHTLPHGIEKGIGSTGSDEPSHLRRCSSSPSHHMPNRDDRPEGYQGEPMAERFWRERLERHKAELEACTDKKRQQELDAAIARAAAHLGGMARGAA